MRESRAELAEYGARYKAIVLVAFEQVEDGLALLHHLGDESMKENNALIAAQRTLTFSMSRYRDGVVSYFDVVTAQTTELDAQVTVLDISTRRFTASLAFTQALGGGWGKGRQRVVGDRCVLLDHWFHGRHYRHIHATLPAS